jgi:hypothetical protein
MNKRLLIIEENKRLLVFLIYHMFQKEICFRKNLFFSKNQIENSYMV